MNDRRTNAQHDSTAYQRRGAQKPTANTFSMKAISRRATVFQNPKGARRLFSTAWAVALLALITFGASAQSISVTPASGVKVGTLVTVTGSGFTANQGVGQFSVAGVPIETGAHLLSATVGTVSGNNVVADSSGAFTVTFRAPATPGGDAKVNLTGATATDTYTVVARIVRFSPLSVKYGDKMTIVGDGFGAGKEVGVSFGSHEQGKIKANGNGQINGQITVGVAPYADGTASHALHALNVGTTSRASAVGVAPKILSGSQLNKKAYGKISILAHGFPASSQVGLNIARPYLFSGINTNANGSIQDGDDAKKALELTLSGDIAFGRRDLVVTVGAAGSEIKSTIPNGFGIVPSLHFDNAALGVGTPANFGADTELHISGLALYTPGVNGGPDVIDTQHLTGTHAEAVRIDLVQNGVVVAAGIRTLPVVKLATLGSFLGGRSIANFTITATDAANLSTGLATIRATGAVSKTVAEKSFYFSSPADTPQLIVVKESGSSERKQNFVPGDTIHYMAIGFASDHSALGDLRLTRAGQVKTIGSITSAGFTPAVDGAFKATGTLPSDLAGGAWTISYANSAATTTTISIMPKGPTVSPSSAQVGDMLTLSTVGVATGGTVTFNVSPTTAVTVTDGSNTDTNTGAGAVTTTVRLGPTPFGKRDVALTYPGGTATTKGGLTVQSKFTHVDGLNRDRDNAPLDEDVTKLLGDGLTIVGTGQAANSMLELWLDTNRTSAKDSGDAKLNTFGSTSNANGSYNLTADLSSVTVSDLNLKYSVFLVDPKAKTTVRAPVLVKFDASYTRPIATYTSNVKSGMGQITVQGFAYDQNGVLQPGKNLGYLVIGGRREDLSRNNADDSFVEGNFTGPGDLIDRDGAAGPFKITFNTPELSKGRHSLTLDGQTVYITVAERAAQVGTATSAKVGDELKVSAFGFGANESVTVKVDGKVAGSKAANGAGTAKEISFKIPNGVKGGTYDVVVESASAKVASAFKITVVPGISINPSHGTTQETVTVTGKGYRANEGITFTFGGYEFSAGTIVTANANGEFTQTLNVPSASFNKDGIALMARGNQTLASGSAKFLLAADLRLTGAQALQVGSGTMATVIGDGFAYQDSIKFSVSGKDSATTATAGANGSFTATVAIPRSQGGIQTIKAEATNGSRQIDELTVNVTSSLEILSGNPGTVGSELRVQAHGFQNGTRVKFFIEHPTLGNRDFGIHKDDHDERTAGKQTGNNGSTNTVRIYFPTVPMGEWTIVAHQEGGEPDPLTDKVRQARAKVTVNPRVTHINNEGNTGKWKKRVTVDGTFKVRGNGFNPGGTITMKDTDANGKTFVVTNNAVKNDGTFDLTATVFDRQFGVVNLYVDDGKGGTATAVNAIDIGSIISVSPTSGKAGTSTVTITGSGFAPGAVTFRFHPNGENVFTGTSSTTAIVGQKVVTFSGTLNPLAPNGWQEIVATDGLGKTAKASILITSGTALQITLNKTAAKVGDKVTVTGTNYTANSSYPVTFAGNAATINSVSVGQKFGSYIRTDANGSFRFEATLPNSPKGSAQPFRVGANHAVQNISITEKVTVSAANGTQEGGTITVKGTGFLPGETLALKLHRYFFTQSGMVDSSGGAVDSLHKVTRVSADNAGIVWSGGANRGNGFRALSDGSFHVTLNSPGIPLADHRVEVHKVNSLNKQAFSTTKLEQSHNTFRSRAKTSLSISTSTVYNDSSGVGGNNTGQLIVSGVGFQANQPVTVSLPGWSQNYTADQDGSILNLTVTVAGAQFGSHNLTAASNNAHNNNFKKPGFHRATNRVNVASEIVVTPSTVSPGGSVTVHGFGFGNDNRGGKNDEYVRIRVSGVEQGNHKGIVNPQGRWSRNFTIPAAIKSGNNLTGFPGGTVVVSAQGHGTGGSGYAEDSLSIIPIAKILNSSVAPGGNIEIQGYGFPANTPITFYLDSSPQGTGVYVQASVRNNTTNSRGGLEKALVVSQAFENPNIYRHVRWQVQGANSGSAIGAGNTTNTYTAKPSISVEPTTGRGGESIRVVGNGFARNPVGVTVGGTSASFVNASVGTLTGGMVTPNNKGQFTARFNAPENVAPGVANVVVGTASTHFVYSTPGTNRTLMVLKGGSGGPGTEVTIRGYNYASFEPLGRIRFDHEPGFGTPQLIRGVSKVGNGGWQVIGNQVSADVNGVFEVKFRTPENTSDSVGGAKYIDTENAASETAATVTVTSSIARNPRGVSPGSTVTITGKGYGSLQNLGKAFVEGGIGTLGGDIKANANGVVNATIKIPDKGKPGIWNRDVQLKVQNVNVHKDALQLRNAQRLTSVSPKEGGSGTLVRVKAEGLWANMRVEVKFDGNSITDGDAQHVSPYNILTGMVDATYRVSTDASGKLDFYFNVPPSDSGTRKIWLRQYAGGDRNKNHRGLLSSDFTITESIAVRPVSGNVGDEVTVTGTGFGNKQYLTVNVGGVNISPTFRSNSDGSFNAKFKVPEVPGGVHTVTVGRASSKLAVGSAYGLSAKEAKIGDMLTVSGMGMKANSAVTIHLGNGQTASVSTGANGSVSQSFLVQDTSSDRKYTATLVDSDGNTRIAGTWDVIATATMSPASGNPGDEVTITLKGYSRYERVRVTIGGPPAVGAPVGAVDGSAIPVDENGTLAGATVRVPNLPPGKTKLVIIGQALNSRGSSVNRLEFDFTVNSAPGKLTVRNISGGSVSSASPGDRIRVEVPETNTFEQSESVTVTYPGLTAQTQTANANGSMSSVSFTVPDKPGGKLNITAVGKNSGATRTIDFTVVPKVTLLVPSKLDLGDQVTVDGVGAGANDTLEIWMAPAAKNSDGETNGANDGVKVTIDTGGTADANGRFKTTFRVLNALYENNPQPVRIRVKSVGSDLTSPWFGRAVTLQVVTKGVRVALSPASEGPGDAVLTLEGSAADNNGNTRIQENIGNVELAHGSISNGARQKVKFADLEILDKIGEKEDLGGYATIRTNLLGRFKARVNLTKLNGGKPMPSGIVTIYVGGELVTTSYTVKPELRLMDGDKRITQPRLGQDYVLKGISFSRTRGVTLLLGGKAATTATLTTDGNGEFSTTVNWAAGSWVGGPQALTATTQYDAAALPLTILGTITGVTAGTAVKVGDMATVSGHGYGSSEALTFTVGGNAAMATEGGTTNADGTFTANIEIPAASSGEKDLKVVSDTSEATVAGAYAIGASFSVAAKANADTNLAVKGSGYGANEAVSVAVAGESPETVTADANGSFSATVALTATLDHGSSVSVAAGSQTASFLYDSMAEAQSIMASPNPAGSGKTVTVSANIEAGSTAAFSVAGVDGASGALEAVEDGEAPEGFMAVAGTYAVEEGADITDAAVTVTVTDGIGNVTEHDGGTLTIDTVAPTGTAALSADTIRNNLSFTVTATSEETGLTAAADVSGVDTTQVDAVALTESDDGGTYSAEVTVSQSNEALPGDKTVIVTLTDAAGNSFAINVVIELRANTSFTLNLRAGLNLIHVPVNEDGLDRASDLYKKINNGGDLVNAVVMLNDDTKFVSYTGGTVGSAVDLPLKDSIGVMVLMKQASSVTFTGGPLNESVPLQRGINLIGVPRDGVVSMASDIAALGQPNVTLTTLALVRDSDGDATFIAVTPGSDVAVTGGQGFIVVASAQWALTMPGDPWENGETTATAASAKQLRPTSTPLLIVEGSLAREDTMAALNGLEVSVTNLRTGQKATEKVGATAGSGRFSAAMLDLQGGRYEASDEFEVQVVDPSGAFGGVPKMRIVLDAEDVVSGRLDLGRLLLSAVPDKTALLPNYPNPFNPETWIPFQLAESSRVTVTIYNAAGQTVRTLELGQLPAGTYHSRSKAAYWDGRNALGERVASGLYFYRIEAGSFSQLRRMMILK